ncbi:hypothetical protein RND71_031635 [Anisodus tanguticus]|uniref:Uncharacterized protein n=1 Tax=Anisodus tanguticus TaxID=243964 RepID=A0AAE1V5T7_9SOLA|nr:hypothetical protein RND71_031635 [Anisodus tanguticus]
MSMNYWFFLKEHIQELIFTFVFAISDTHIIDLFEMEDFKPETVGRGLGTLGRNKHINARKHTTLWCDSLTDRAKIIRYKVRILQIREPNMVKSESHKANWKLK